MNEIYNYILEGLRNLSKTQNDEEAFKKYLRSLQPYVKSLRQSYKTDCVTVDYSEPKTQAAYLITYYPQYAEMTCKVLKELEQFSPNRIPFKHRHHLNICLFGAGAAPEIAGLVSFCAEHFPNIKSMLVRAYDIYADTWRISQSITKEYIVPKLWSGTLACPTYKLDICQEDVFHQLTNIIQESHIFIFQNCLNELINKVTLKQNFEFLFQKIPIRPLA